MGHLQFDATQVDPALGGGGLPVGRHKVIIESDETRQVKDDSESGMLSLKLKCVEGEAQGQTQSYNLNIYNKSEEAKRIAYQQLSAICHVLGKYKINDTSELHNIPFYVDIRKQKNDDKYTEVGAIFDINGNPPTKGGQPQGQAQTAGFSQPQQGQQQPNPGAGAGGPAPAQTAPWNAPQGGQQAGTGSTTPPWQR